MTASCGSVAPVLAERVGSILNGSAAERRQ
jgi:hypothetical protein